MPNKRSAAKRMRQNEKQRLYNKYWISRCKTSVKKVIEAVEAGDSELSAKRFDMAQATIDKAVGKGVIHKNTGARRKSNLAMKVKSLANSQAKE